jgi:hypothetical protein
MKFCIFVIYIKIIWNNLIFFRVAAGVVVAQLV